MLVKYTWSGDATLNGVIDSSDFSRVDNGYLMKLTGWFNGDFNYDGVVDRNDYTIIDNTYAYSNTSGITLAMSGANTGPLATLEQLWHWKLPGYAAYYLPIYEANFGPLTTSQYDQALAAGTPLSGAVPAYFAPEASLFSSGSPVPLLAVSSVPEPSFGFLVSALGVGYLGRRKRRSKKS